MSHTTIVIPSFLYLSLVFHAINMKIIGSYLAPTEFSYFEKKIGSRALGMLT